MPLVDINVRLCMMVQGARRSTTGEVTPDNTTKDIILAASHLLGAPSVQESMLIEAYFVVISGADIVSSHPRLERLFFFFISYLTFLSLVFLTAIAYPTSRFSFV